MSRFDGPVATRRAVLSGICGGACTAAFTACGRESAAPPAPSPVPAPGAGPSPAPAGGGAPALIATSDVPVGGGRVFPEYRLVVTRPAPEELKAFTAICTHDGCMLTTVADGTIDCPCHGSRFAITDGAVVSGPAMRALTSRSISVHGGSIVLGT
jgi:Rieske Fe-S protein